VGKTHQTDVLVIGAGPGGYSAAFRAADLGLSVTILTEEERLGGVCLLRGCIPSKALLHAAGMIHEAADAAEMGLQFAQPKVDVDRLRGWKDGIVHELTDGIAGMARQRNVEVVHGKGVFVESTRVQVEGNDEISQIQYDHCILAVGSLPTRLPGTDKLRDDPRLIDSSGALALKDVPRSLLVVGAGYIGMELGSVYAALGSEVTVVEFTPLVLPGADRDIARVVQKRAEPHLKDIWLESKVANIEPTDDGLKVRLEGKQEGEHTFDKVLVSIGRTPNSRGIGLENTNVQVSDRGFVQVNRQQRTHDSQIFAIGDVVGQPMLAHKAHHEGHIAAEVIAGEDVYFDASTVPAVVFTNPEIAWCGLTEVDAQDRKVKYEVGRFPWAASGRAKAVGSDDGLTKILFDPTTRRVLGVGIVGTGAGELISEGVLAVEMSALAQDLALSIHPHPTLSETLSGAAEAFLGTATDIVNPRRKK
jgi:dihydrolipoamide dehydrogenase